jgi:hypothetical protein
MNRRGQVGRGGEIVAQCRTQGRFIAGLDLQQVDQRRLAGRFGADEELAQG